MPRSNRRCCPGWDGDWFGGKSSTRIATFFIRLRNSCGSKSNASSTTLTKCSRFILHPTEISKGRLTPSSHRRPCRHHRYLLCRRLRLPLRLPRLVEGRHRRLPTDPKGLSRGIPDVFCSYQMVVL